MNLQDMTTEQLLVLCDDWGLMVFNRTPDFSTGDKVWHFAPQSAPELRSDRFDSMRGAALGACMAYGIRPGVAFATA